MRGQLDAHVAKLIEVTPAYRNGSEQLQQMGVSLADVAAAAQGNGPALDRINAAVMSLGGPLSEAGSNFQMMIDAMFRAAGGSSELGVELNRMAGQFAEAQQQRDAATAARDFGATSTRSRQGSPASPAAPSRPT